MKEKSEALDNLDAIGYMLYILEEKINRGEVTVVGNKMSKYIDTIHEAISYAAYQTNVED